jgi:hypothetical protein
MISGNNSAQEVLYNLGENGTLSKVMTFFTTDNGIGYRISFYLIPEQNYVPIIQRMINSFRIL